MEDVGGDRDRIDAAFDALWAIYSGPTLYAWMELVIAARTDAAVLQQTVEQFLQVQTGGLPGKVGLSHRARAFAKFAMARGAAFHMQGLTILD